MFDQSTILQALVGFLPQPQITPQCCIFKIQTFNSYTEIDGHFRGWKIYFNSVLYPFLFGNIFLLLVLIFKSIIFELLHNSLVIRKKEESKGGYKKTNHAKISKKTGHFYLLSMFCFCNHRFEMHPFFITDEFSKINRNKCILRFPLNQSIFHLVLSKI